MRFKYFTIILAILSSSLVAFADTVTTKDGSIINGEITLIDKGVINIETSYAGKLKLKQENVVSFETASPLEFRLRSGAFLSGTVTSKNKDTLSVQYEGKTKEISANQIAAGWTPDKIDPEIERNRRKWKNDFAVNLNGRTGNVERFNLGVNLNVRLKSPLDELRFGFSYEEGEENGNVTADRTFGQIGYERFSKDKAGWFARSVMETDPINGIGLRSTTSYGISCRLINDEVQTLIFRGGLGYRYTEFEDDDRDNESTLTLEPGLVHSYRCNDWFYIENELNYSPSIENFNNYTVIHDSSIKIPVGNDETFWIRMGVRNEYESKTSTTEKLDTNYYSQLIYSWK